MSSSYRGFMGDGRPQALIAEGGSNDGHDSRCRWYSENRPVWSSPRAPGAVATGHSEQRFVVGNLAAQRAQRAATIGRGAVLHFGLPGLVGFAAGPLGRGRSLKLFG